MMPFVSGGGGGGAVTFDPSHAFQIAFTNSNLTVANTSATAAYGNTKSTTSHTTGKYYIEALIAADDGASNMMIGVCNGTWTAGSGAGHAIGSAGNNSIGLSDSGAWYINAVPTALLTAFTTQAGHIICMAVDLDHGKIWWRLDGVGYWNANATYDPGTNTGGIDFSALGTPGSTAIFVAAECETSSEKWTVNFGATSYAYAAPSGTNGTFGAW